MKKQVVSAVATAAILSGTFAHAASASTYTVQKGDTLSNIAIKFKTSVPDLKKMNKLTSDFLQIKQVLKVSEDKTPTASKPAVTPPPVAAKPTSTTVQQIVYTVASGDSLSKIAFAKGVSIADIMKWNNLSSTLIFPGDRLKISAPVVATTQTPPAATPDPAPVATDPSVVSEYTIQNGDTLGVIAAQFGMSINDIKTLNNMSSDVIFAGQTVKVTGQAIPTSTQPKLVELTAAVLREAKALMGVPYVWGGSSNSGFDCSGFVYYVFNKAGFATSRYNAAGFYNRSYYVDRPQPGDLVFFENTYKPGISHVGIYIGDNQFIHADENRGIAITSLSNTYFQAHFDGFKRFY